MWNIWEEDKRSTSRRFSHICKELMVMIEGVSFLPLPAGMCMESIEQPESDLVVSVVSTSPTSCCPLCPCPSSSVHTYYPPRIRTIPAVAPRVRLPLPHRK